MVPAGNKAKCLLLVSDTTKTIHHNYDLYVKNITLVRPERLEINWEKHKDAHKYLESPKHPRIHLQHSFT